MKSFDGYAFHEDDDIELGVSWNNRLTRRDGVTVVEIPSDCDAVGKPVRKVSVDKAAA